MPELLYLRSLAGLLVARLQATRSDERGAFTTETVLVTALLAALAIAAVGIIVTKVTAKANSIPTGP